MPSPPRLSQTLTQPISYPLETLTLASFAPFGTAICSPFPTSLNVPPRSIPIPRHAPQQASAVFANQNSALKTSPISTFENRYLPTPVSRPQMSMFSCFPRNLSGIGIERETGVEPRGPAAELRFRVNILERHPYTTQTFAPLGVSADQSGALFLVIVAPSLHGLAVSSDDGSSQIVSPPDLTRLRAFVARGDQAVTYGAGTWHAPMVVLGDRRVDFLVTQFVNGVADDDCQEVLLGGNVVRVDLGRLGLTIPTAPDAHAATLAKL